MGRRSVRQTQKDGHVEKAASQEKGPSQPELTLPTPCSQLPGSERNENKFLLFKQWWPFVMAVEWHQEALWGKVCFLLF